MRPLIISLTLIIFYFPFVWCTPSSTIIGDGTISCLPTQKKYKISESVNFPNAKITWFWQVTGGEFANGKKTIKQEANDPKTVTVNWQHSGLKQGSLVAKLIIKNKVVKIFEKEIYFQMPQPTAIAIIEDGLLCEGNWFSLKTNIPLTNDEIVLWEIENGLDENGQSIRYIESQSEGSNKIFIKQNSESIPLKISAKIKSDCGMASKISMLKNSSYSRSPINIIGSRNTEENNETTFYTCSIPPGKNYTWNSSGIITGLGEASVSIRFPEIGIGKLELIYDDCAGNEKSVSILINVNPSISGVNKNRVIGDRLHYNVFPNPSINGSLELEIMEDFISGYFEILNLQGLPIKSETIASKRKIIETSGIPPGFYIMRIRTDKKEAVLRIGININ